MTLRFVNLLAWWRRKVAVESFSTPKLSDGTLITIDEGDGTEPQMLALTRNNLCSMAWVIREADRRGLKNVSLTLEVPEGPDVWSQTLTVPNWAKRKLFREVIARALALGWKGEVYHPSPTAWDQLLRDEGL